MVNMMQFQNSTSLNKPILFALNKFTLLAIIGGLIMPLSIATATSRTVDIENSQCSDTGTGTAQAPFCSISASAIVAIAGDTVTVFSGHYQEHVALRQSGTPGSPITFSVAPDNTVTISGHTNGFELSDISWVTIEGFNIDSTDLTGIILDTTASINLRSNDVNNTGEHGIEIKNSTDIAVTSNDIADSLQHGIYVRGSSSVTLSNNHVSGSGLPVQSLTGKGIYFRNTINSSILGNTAESNTNSGIYISHGSSNNQVFGNHTFNNARGYIRAAPGIELRNSFNNTIEANISYANEDTGIQVYPGSSNNLIVNNLTYDNGDHGIDLLNAPDNRVINNSVYNNVTSGINIEGSSTGSTIANNISVDNAINSPRTRGNIRVDSQSVPGTALNHNLIFLSQPDIMITWDSIGYASLGELQANSSQESAGIEADPEWVNPSNGDFHLNPMSPAIDSADASASGTLNKDFEMLSRIDDPNTVNTGIGSAPYYDRGAHEFQAGINIPPSIAITSPGNNTSVSGEISIIADAFDLDGSVAGVQFKVNGINLGAQVAGEPYSIFWDTNTVADGAHILTAVATDNEGKENISDPINVSVANNLIQLSITASDDAYIRMSKPGSNKGSSNKLWVDSAPSIYEVLLKFNITGVGAKQITDIKLALQTSNSSVAGGEIYFSDNAWSEQTVTWNNAPSIGQYIGTLGAVSSNTTALLDLSSVITGDGTYSIRIKAVSSDAAGYYSKETVGLEPKILITAQ